MTQSRSRRVRESEKSGAVIGAMGFALASHLLWSCLSLGVSLWTFVFIMHPAATFIGLSTIATLIWGRFEETSRGD